MEEFWKDINGYEERYQVSNFGRVRSKDHIVAVNRGSSSFCSSKKGKILIPLERRHGYLSVCLYGNGGSKSRFRQYSIHRLVADAFIPKEDGKNEVNHIDENKKNNFVGNLEWVSHKENMNCGTVQKRKSETATNGVRSKKINQYTIDGKYVASFLSISDAERKTGYAKANICRCAKGDKNYSHAYGYLWRYAT